MVIATDSPVRRLAAAGYLMSALLVLLPLADIASGVIPLQTGSLYWRYGAAGQLSRVLLEPALGGMLAAFIAVSTGNRAMRKLLAILFSVVAVVLLAITAMFILDALQMQRAVRLNLQRAFRLATVAAMVRYMTITVLAGVAAYGVRNRKSSAKSDGRKRSELPSATWASTQRARVSRSDSPKEPGNDVTDETLSDDASTSQGG